MKKFLKIVIALVFISNGDVIAQPTAAPSCPSQSIFAHNGSIINQHALPNGPGSALLSNLPSGASGLAIGPSFTFPAPNPTWWTTAGSPRTYWYYNNTGTWSNTGHQCINTAAVNLGGGGTCLYNLVGASGNIYKYTGTGNDVLLTTLVPAFSGQGPYDVVCDLADYFYILKASPSAQQGIYCYNPQGVLTCSWSITGMINQTAGGGFSILNTVNPSIHRMYYNSNGTDYIGNMLPGNSIIVSTVQALPSGGDYASCALDIPTGTIIAPMGGTLTCNLNQIPLVAQVWGNASLGWTGGYNTPTTSPVSPTCGGIVWSGPSIVSGQNTPTINVNAPGVYSYTVTGCNGCPGYSITASYTVIGLASVLTPSITAPLCYTGPSTMFVTPNASTNTVLWSGPGIVGPNNTFTISFNQPGTYTAVVSSGTNCSGSATVLVSPAPIPTVTSNAPVCAGQTINFTALGGNTYTWTGPNNFSTTIQNPSIPNAQLVNSGTYTLWLSNTGGCSNSITIVANVNPLPTITVNNPTVCTGGNINLTVNAASTYTWVGPNAFASNLQNPTITNASTIQAGNYTISVTSAGGCTAQSVATVIVNPTPTITVGNTGPYCAGSTIQLTLTPSNTYTWSGPNAFSSNAQNPTIANSTTLMSGPYIVTVSAVGGCVSTGTTNVVVNALPTPTATSNSPVCLNNPINLFVNAASSYTWSGPNIFNSNAQNPSIATSSLVNGGNYTVTVTNASGCTNSSVVNVIVNPLPAIVVNTPVACVGSTFSLTATGGTAYAWIGPNTFNSSAQDPLFANAQTTLNGNYTVNVTSAQGCTNSAVTTVSVIGMPTVSILGTNTLCSQNFNSSPNTTTLTASGAGTYLWILPPGFSGSPNLSSNPLVITPPITSTSMVATMTVLGTAGSCTNQAVYTLTVIPNPTIATTSGSMCAGTSVTLTASNAVTYTWTPSATLNTANGPSVIASPAVTTAYSIIGSSVGCNSQTQNATATVVNNPTITILPNQAVICVNESINLTASGANNYTWSPNTALTTTNTPNTTANPTVTTIYQVIGEAATCTNVANITVSVLPLPTITIVPSSPTLCINNYNGSPNTVSLTASGAASYTWGSIVGLNTNTLNGSQIIGTSNGNPVATGIVIGANGSCTSSATFTVNAIANPVIATTNGSMCAGTSVSLTAANAQTYTWSPIATLNTANGPIVIANPTVTTLYSVIGSSAGCQGQTQNATATVVNNPTVSIAPNTPTICFGSSIGLTANGATNYTWSPNTAITATIGANVTVNPTVTTVYSIIGEAATCTNTAAQTVTVVPLPIINIALNSPTMCMNNYNGSINTISVTASGATSYNWTGFTGINANSSSGSQIVVTALPNTAIGTGTVVGSAQTCTSSATFTVLANDNPIISVPSVSLCQGTSAVITASGAQTYQWSPPNNLSSTTGSTVIANPAQTSVYSVIGSSVNCQSPTETTTVTVVANPVIAISPVNPTICAGTPIGLTAIGANNYTWSPAVNINTVNGNFVIVNPTVTTNYVVIGEAATCTSTAVRQVKVIQLPNLQAICDHTAICIGDKTNINANGALAYTWSPSGGLSNVNSNFVIADPTVSTNYTLIGTNGTCSASISVPIAVIPKPVLQLTTNTPKICFGNKSTIFASGAQSYSWSPMTDSTVVNYAVVSPTVSTNYTVTGINYASGTGCAFTKEILIEVVQPVTAVVNNSVAICEGESVKLTAGGSNTYVWAPGTGLSNSMTAQPYASPKESTEYTVYVSDGGNCADKAVVMVKVNPLPVVDAGPDLTFNADEPMYLDAHGTGTLTWTFGDGIICYVCPNSQFMTKQSGTYKIQAINKYGCIATDDVNVEITNEYGIYIPNVFTPNFDGKNETFLVYGVGISEIQVTVFDRWGEQVHHEDNQTTGWDGTFKGELCKNDVYVYLVSYKSLDGKKHTKTGHVTLLK